MLDISCLQIVGLNMLKIGRFFSNKNRWCRGVVHTKRFSPPDFKIGGNRWPSVAVGEINCLV